MALVESITVFLVSLFIGALGIHVAAKLIVGKSDYEGAIFTAIIGSFIWGAMSFLFGWVPVLGAVITLLAWVWIINRRYPGGWIKAGAIGFTAWLTVLLILYLLALAGVTGFDVVGIPWI